MSNFLENEKTEFSDQGAENIHKEEFSTIFSDPIAHKNTAEGGSKNSRVSARGMCRA